MTFENAEANTAKPLLRTLAGKCFSKSHRWSSLLGEKLGWEWLIYNPLVILCFERSARATAPKLADALLAEYPTIQSAADVGCGGGGYAAELQRRGLRVVGCEYGEAGRKRARKKGVKVYEFDLSKSEAPLPDEPFDLAISIEVGEHIPSQLAQAFVRFLTQESDLVVFTAAHPGQGGHGHINEQPRSYWIEKFERCHFDFDSPAAARIAENLRKAGAYLYIIENLLVFRKRVLAS